LPNFSEKILEIWLKIGEIKKKIDPFQEFRHHYPESFDSDDEISENFPNSAAISAELIKPEFDTLWETQRTEKFDQIPQKLKSVKTQNPGETDFLAKPSLVKFSNFEMGKSYSKTVTLTNITSQMTAIRFAGISPNLVDLCSYQFEPKPALRPELEIFFSTAQNFYNAPLLGY